MTVLRKLQVLSGIFLLTLFISFMYVSNNEPRHQTNIKQLEQTYEQLQAKQQIAQDEFDAIASTVERIDHTKNLTDEFMLKDNIYVIDDADILSDEQKIELYKINKNVFEASDKKPQIAFVTLPYLPSNTDMGTYRYNKFQELGVGQKDENNGLLFVLAIADNPDGTAEKGYGLEVGYGLEDVFPDGIKRKLITNDVLSLLRSDRFADAFMLIAKNIETQATERFAPTYQASKTLRQLDELLRDVQHSKESAVTANALQLRFVQIVMVMTLVLLTLTAFVQHHQRRLKRSLIAIFAKKQYIETTFVTNAINEVLGNPLWLKSKTLEQKTIQAYETAFKQACRHKQEALMLRKGNESAGPLVDYLAKTQTIITNHTVADVKKRYEYVLNQMMHTTGIAVMRTKNNPTATTRTLLTYTDADFDTFLYRAFYTKYTEQYISNDCVNVDVHFEEYRDEIIENGLVDKIKATIRQITPVKHFVKELNNQYEHQVIEKTALINGCNQYLAENQLKLEDYQNTMKNRIEKQYRIVLNAHFSAIPCDVISTDHNRIFDSHREYPNGWSQRKITDQVYDDIKKQSDRYITDIINNHIAQDELTKYKPYRIKKYDLFVYDSVQYNHFYQGSGSYLLETLEGIHKHYTDKAKKDRQQYKDYLDQQERDRRQREALQARASSSSSSSSSSFGGGSSGGGGFSGGW